MNVLPLIKKILAIISISVMFSFYHVTNWNVPWLFSYITLFWVVLFIFFDWNKWVEAGK